MKDLFKNKLATILVIIATIVLAGVAIFTAIRLYQLRQESVVPTVPESKPGAAAPPSACTGLTFTIGQVTPGLNCTNKKAYEDDSRNRPGVYYLEKEIASGAKVQVGQRIVYTISWSNTGTAQAKDAIGSDTLPGDVDYVDGDTECTYTAATRKVVCRENVVQPPGSSGRWAFRVKVKDTTASDTIYNSAEVSEALSSVTTSGTVPPISSCDVSLTLGAAATATATPTNPPGGTTPPGGTNPPGSTATPTLVAQASPTSAPSLPVAGVSLPTMVGIGAGILLLIISLVLAL